MCCLVCLLQQVPPQAQVSHPELVPSAQPVQPTLFSSPLQNGADPGTAIAAAHLDNSNPCQLALQAQGHSQVQSQIPVLQSSESQRASAGSASSSLTQQKHLSALTGAASLGPTEANTEVWACVSLPQVLVPTMYFLLIPHCFERYQNAHMQYYCTLSQVTTRNII